MSIAWGLREVDNVKSTKSDIGVYVHVHRITGGIEDAGHATYCITDVRADILTTIGHTPLISFQGQADDVRKATVKYLTEFKIKDIKKLFGGTEVLSTEHASYIGSECTRASLDVHYIQG